MEFGGVVPDPLDRVLYCYWPRRVPLMRLEQTLFDLLRYINKIIIIIINITFKEKSTQ